MQEIKAEKIYNMLFSAQLLEENRGVLKMILRSYKLHANANNHSVYDRE